MMDFGGFIAGNVRVEIRRYGDDLYYLLDARIWRTGNEQARPSWILWCLRGLLEFASDGQCTVFWYPGTVEGQRCVPILQRLGGELVSRHTRLESGFRLVALGRKPSESTCQHYLSRVEPCTRTRSASRRSR